MSYNYQLTDRLDLVVAQSSCSDARELLKSFDLLICAAYYDGETFHIPHPHMTFQKRSSMEPLRLSMMKAFQAEWKKYHGKVDEGIEDFHESPWFKAIEKSLQDAGIKGYQWIINRDTSRLGRRHPHSCWVVIITHLLRRRYGSRQTQLRSNPG